MSSPGERPRTPKTAGFLNQWASMLNVMSSATTSTPLSEARDHNPLDAFQDDLQQSPVVSAAAAADFAANPPLFTCSYCPFILLDAHSLEEHERQHHHGQVADHLVFDDSLSGDHEALSGQLFGGNLANLSGSPHQQSVTHNNTSGSINLSAGSANQPGSNNTSGSGRQFGRTLQQGQVTEMQQSLSNSSPPNNTSGSSVHSPANLLTSRPFQQINMQLHSLQNTGNRTSAEKKNAAPASNAQITSDESPESEVSKKGKRGGRSRKGQYRCEYCQKVFGYQQNLNQHRRMHTGEKYKCNVCDKEFNFSQNLHQHMRVHSGKKEYKCPYCCKEFNDAANFHRHKRVIHGITGKTKDEKPKNVENNNPHPHMKQTEDDINVNMPFSCPRCAMCFVLDSSLQKHLQHCISPSREEDSNDGMSGPMYDKPKSVKSQNTSEKRKRSQKSDNKGGSSQGKTKKARLESPNDCKENANQSQENTSPKQLKSCSVPPPSYQSPPVPQSAACASSSQASLPTSSPFQQSCQSPLTSPAASCQVEKSRLTNFPIRMSTSPQFSSGAISSHQSSPSPNHSFPKLSPHQTHTNVGYIFVCPYCGFGVTNNMVFREHLHHHRDSILQQYSRFLTHGQLDYNGIISNIMMSSMQVLNPSMNSPVMNSSSGNSDMSYTDSSHISPNQCAQVNANKPQSRQLYNTPIDGLNASYEHTLPTSMWQQHLSNSHSVNASQCGFQKQHQRKHVQQVGGQQPAAAMFGTVTPPHLGHLKREFDDSGIVEGDAMTVSPWRLMNDPL